MKSRSIQILLLLTASTMSFLSSQSQTPGKVLHAEKIIKLIPNKLEGFSMVKDPVSKLIKLGTLQYSMAEKTFSSHRNRSIKILLFDYKEAPIMYNQATRKWTTFNTIESDSITQRPTNINNCTGWEAYDAKRKSSQILVGIFNRFYLTVEGTNVDLEVLRKVLQEFKFDTFPK